MKTEITTEKTDDKYLEQHIQRVWLIRHGQTEWNAQQRFCGHTDIPLSTTGRRQAQWFASQLQHKPITTLYTSDLVRTRETATIIAAERPVQVIASSAWREVAFGAWEGLTYTQIETRFKDELGFFSDPEHYAPPDGETVATVLQRVQFALNEILRNRHTSDKGDIGIVSHGGPLRVLLCSLLGIPLSRQWQLRVDPGSLSAVDLSLDENGSVLASLALLNMQRTPHIRRIRSTGKVDMKNVKSPAREMEQVDNA